MIMLKFKLELQNLEVDYFFPYKLTLIETNN